MQHIVGIDIELLKGTYIIFSFFPTALNMNGDNNSVQFLSMFSEYI